MIDKSNILVIGSDHAGFMLKKFLIKKLENYGYKTKDFGTYSEASVDYPDIIHPLAEAIVHGKFNFGIIICGTGNGVSMTANKHSKIRAALCWNKKLAKFARLHNNANIIALPARFIRKKTALKTVMKFLNTDFEQGRHKRRVEKISSKQVEI
jgi:ribose 5-phosphate isomerase B